MRLQSALEYLTTYGWAILIISVVALALFAILSTANTSQEQCILPSGFFCPSVIMSQNGLLQLDLVQSTQYPVKVTALGCMTPESLSYMVPVNNPPSNYILIPVGSNYTFNVQCYSNASAYYGNIKSTYSGTLVVNYTNAYTNFPNTLFGSVRVSVTK